MAHRIIRKHMRRKPKSRSMTLVRSHTRRQWLKGSTSSRSIKQDRERKSQEPHEIAYRRRKR